MRVGQGTCDTDQHQSSVGSGLVNGPCSWSSDLSGSCPDGNVGPHSHWSFVNRESLWVRALCIRQPQEQGQNFHEATVNRLGMEVDSGERLRMRQLSTQDVMETT